MVQKVQVFLFPLDILVAIGALMHFKVLRIYNTFLLRHPFTLSAIVNLYL